MAQLYLRKVIVTLIPGVGQPKRFSNLRVRFRCEKSNESKPNPAEVEIFNLAAATRSSLETKNSSILLEAGYEDTVETLFAGDITKIVHQQEGSDIISKAEVKDGGNKYRNAKIEKGLPPGVKTQQIIDELIKELGLPRGTVIGVPNSQYANGVALSGLVKDRLDDICKKNGLQWSIQNGIVQVVPEGETTTDAPILLSPDTGLIGSPSKTKEGVEFTSLLQPKLIPGRPVQLESKFLKGLFKVYKVSHEGDSETEQFLSKVETAAKKKG